MPDIARIMRYTMEMDAPLVTRPLVGTLQCTDKKADTIQLAITSGGAAVSLTGSSAVGLFRRPVDGTQVRCPGTISGGTITVPLLDQCYMYAGDFDLLIKLTGSGVERTVLRISGYVEAGGDGVIVDPSGSIPSYDDLAEAIASANTAAANANAKATAADTAATNANTKATAANNAASAANTAASNANTKATAADTAASAANNAAAKINNMTVAATGLAAGAAPTATVSEVSGHKHIAFGIPQGAKGDTGATPALSIGTVTTGAPGTQASASMGGTAAAPVLNLTIPRGDAGSGSVSTVDSIQPDGGNVPLGAVRYSAAQTLSDAQKQQARNNIGAGTGSGTVKTVDGETPYVEGDVHINAVRYTAQTLTEAQKTQARTNIAALGADDVVNNLTSTETSKPLSAAQGKTLKDLIDNQTGGDPTVVEITATALASKNTTQRAAMYTDGARLLKVTNGDTVVILSLASDGSTQFLSSNKPLNNLLDNSDFTNPVNQRSNTSYSLDSGYTIDRWTLKWSGANCTLQVANGYISLSRPTNAAYLFQLMPNASAMLGKTYTITAKMKGNGYIGWIDSEQRVQCTSIQTTDWTNGILTFTPESAASDVGGAAAEIGCSNNSTVSVEWIALYEGSYTADTLPPYTPKGFATEMRECRRYYRHKEFFNCAYNRYHLYSISQSIAMRAIPTVTMLQFSPYGDDNITSFGNDSLVTVQQGSQQIHVTYAKINESERAAGGLVVNLDADL